ncbi:MAG: Ig-like domain repeat protein, partial [Candidatus Acidiferrales bacterium]
MPAFLISCLLAFPGLVSAQTSGPKPLITQAVNETKLTRLAGNTHPLARPEFDRGAAPFSLPMQRMLLVLTRSTDQEAALQTLLQEQQDQSSPSFHKWLTPGEFGQQFGPSGQDVQTVATWLAAHGFQVTSVSNGRNVIEFSGTAAQVQEAFHTTIHSYVVNGGQYWANDSDPQIPRALAAVVVGVDSLDSFPRKPMHRLGSMFTKPAQSAQASGMKPLLTYQCGNNPNTGAPLYCNSVTPYDFATIYNVLPLWNASPPIDGNGQAIAIVGRSNINVQDVTNFRSIFGLPPNPPQIILDVPDPGIVQGDETEADLDVEWSGAVARSATIQLVVSQSTETTDGVDLSALYIVDNNVAPLMSESFLGCELDLGTAGNQFYKNLWEQAAAQGISVFVSAGDQGSAGCDFFQGNPPQPARSGLQVNGLASTPYNVAVGGTDFNDFSNPLLYWNTTNNPATQESAKGYIPETTWNDTCTNAVFASVGFSTNQETNCNNPQLSGTVRAIGGSGGKSNCTTPASSTASSCAGGYAKPPWQTGAGVPGDGKRDLPDVSLFAGAGFIGNSYAICEADLQGPCNSSNFVNIGGTSASSPAFAGLLALVDQKMASRQGNPNFILYKLAAQQPASSCNSTTGPATNCAFNDVTSGTIAMPCATGTLNCTTSNSGDQYGILSGYNAATGYDLATGLGSVNANNMVNNWSSVKFTASSTTLTLNGGNAVNVAHGAPVSVSVSVSPTSPQPTGDVSLIATQGTNTTSVDTLTLSSGTASGSTNMLPGGASYSVKAHYAGDATYGGSDSNAVTVTVTPEASQTALRILTFDPISGQLINPNATTFNYGSAYLLRADVTNNSSTPCFNTTSETQSYACPTGNVALTDNGNAAGPGTFALNSQGSTEFQAIQLSGGSHSLAADYAGDNSYNASSAADTVTVTPAPTTTSTSFNPPLQTVVIGSQFGIFALTKSQSFGAAPTGTYTVFDGTTQLSSNGNFFGFAGTPNQPASCQDGLVTSVSGPSGPHTLTVRYSGDTNYTASTSSAVTVKAVYPITMSSTATPNSIVYGSGSSVTIAVTVDTTNPASNATLRPTGSFLFFDAFDGNLPNPVTTTATQDSSGNWELQASLTFTPQRTEFVNVEYSGDTNYESSPGGGVNVTVIVPDVS